MLIYKDFLVRRATLSTRTVRLEKYSDVSLGAIPRLRLPIPQRSSSSRQQTFNQYQRYSDWGNYLGLPLCLPRDSSPIKGKRKSWELNRPRELFLIKKRKVFFCFFRRINM